MGLYSPSRETSAPTAPAAGFSTLYPFGASDAATVLKIKLPDATVLTFATLETAQSFTAAQTFSAGAVIAASQALTGTVANSTISGFLSVAATTGTFTNVGGTLSTAAQPNITSLGTIAALVAGSLAVGTTPASTGNIRIPNASDINARNAANTTDLHMIGFTSANKVLIDANAGGTLMSGTLAVTGAITGASYSGGAISGTSGSFSTTLGVTGTATFGSGGAATNAIVYANGGSDATNGGLFAVQKAGSDHSYFGRKAIITGDGSDNTLIASVGASAGIDIRTNGTDRITISSAGAVAVTGAITLNSASSRAVDGLRIGADSTNNLLDDASTGAGTATLYIGNASINVTSDENLKFNIQPFKRGLDLVKQLQPIEFDQDEMRPFGHIGHYVGFGARAVQKVAPWAVHTQGDTGLPWQARYEFLMAPVVGAVQELAARLEALERRSQ